MKKQKIKCIKDISQKAFLNQPSIHIYKKAPAYESNQFSSQHTRNAVGNKNLCQSQALSQPPVHPSFGRVKIGLDGYKLCRGVTGRVPKYFLYNNSFT